MKLRMPRPEYNIFLERDQETPSGGMGIAVLIIFLILLFGYWADNTPAGKQFKDKYPSPIEQAEFRRQTQERNSR